MDVYDVCEDGGAAGLQAEPRVGPGEEAALSAPGPVAHPETDGGQSDASSGRSQEPAGVQHKGGEAGGVD